MSELKTVYHVKDLLDPTPQEQRREMTGQCVPQGLSDGDGCANSFGGIDNWLTELRLCVDIESSTRFIQCIQEIRTYAELVFHLRGVNISDADKTLLLNAPDIQLQIEVFDSIIVNIRALATPLLNKSPKAVLAIFEKEQWRFTLALQYLLPLISHQQSHKTSVSYLLKDGSALAVNW